MVHPAIQKRILDQLSLLALEKQQQVLAFAEALGKQSIEGLPGNAYLRFAGLINEEDAASIKNAVEEGCEQVDENEW